MKKPKHKPSSGSTAKLNPPAATPGASPPPATNAVLTEVGSEPVVKRTPLPVVLVGLLGGLVYWGSMYILEFGGQADARVHSPYLSFKELQDLQPKGEEELFIAKGALVYARICSGCHQNDGNGGLAQNAPPLAGSEWVLAQDPSRIIRIVLHGLSGPISVRDREWGAGQMLAWKDVLNDEDIAAVLSYIRNSWGNKAPLVKVDDVKRVRSETKDHAGFMTSADLLKVALKE